MRERFDIYESTQDLMVCELDKIVQKQEISPSTLEYVYKIVDVIKDIDEIISSEYDRDNGNDGYSSRSGRMYNYGSSYRDGYYRRGSSYRDEPMRGNSNKSGKSDMLEHLYKAHDTATSDEERKRIKRMIEEIENS